MRARLLLGGLASAGLLALVMDGCAARSSYPPPSSAPAQSTPSGYREQRSGSVPRVSGGVLTADSPTMAMPASTSIETMTTGRRPASISEEDNPTPPSRPPEPGSDSVDEQPAPAPPAPVAAQPTTRPATTPNGGAGPVGNTDGLAMQERERAIAIARYQAAIDGNRAQIAANLNDCRQVCAASDGICRAAEMICRLTGDNVLGIANARDLRCRRARESCVSAGRERDGACPVCPTPQR